MEASKLASDHWKYVESVLVAAHVDQPAIEIAKFHYLTAFDHGFKHGVESIGVEEQLREYREGILEKMLNGENA